MAWTDQQRALEQLKAKFGPTAYTEDHKDYRLVGFMRGREKVFCVGVTWEKAIEALEKRAQP